MASLGSSNNGAIKQQVWYRRGEVWEVGICQKRSREEGEWMAGADPGRVSLDQSVRGSLSGISFTFIGAFLKLWKSYWE